MNRQDIGERDEQENGRVDNETFEAQKKRLNKKLEVIKKQREGYING